MEIRDQIENLIKEHNVCLFMKGTPDSPQCGFSMAVSNILKHLEVKFNGINVLEDEEHVIFNCRAYDTIRTQFADLLEENATVKDILNPQRKDDAEKVGLMLKLIEEKRNDIF